MSRKRWSGLFQTEGKTSQLVEASAFAIPPSIGRESETTKRDRHLRAWPCQSNRAPFSIAFPLCNKNPSEAAALNVPWKTEGTKTEPPRNRK